MYCPSRCRNSTYQCWATNYPISWWQYRAENGNMRTFGPTYQHGTAFLQGNVYIKRKLRVLRTQKCIALVRGKTPPTCAGLQTTPFQGWQYRIEKGSMRNFWLTIPNGTAFAPKQWLYQKEATRMESSKMYCRSRCRNSTNQCWAANYPISWVAV